MNKRIEELAKGCFEHFEGTLDGDIVEFNYEKFAQLLLKECMTICGAIQGAGEFKNMPDFAAGAEKCKAVIKRDFGVTE